MGTKLINVRFPDEQVEAIEEAVNELNEILPTGTKVNRSSVIVGAVDKFITRKNQTELVFPLNEMSEEDLKALYKITKEIHKPVATWEGSPEERAVELLESRLRKLLKSIEMEILKR